MDHATLGAVILIVLLIAPVPYFISRVRAGKHYPIRRLMGLDAVDEAVGRSVELGRPLSFTTGLTSVGPVLYACLGVLHHIAMRANAFKNRLFVPQSDAAAMAIVSETVRDAASSGE